MKSGGVPAVLLVSLALSTAIVLSSPHPGATLDPAYTDSIRSIYTSWLFLRHGWDVYRRTLGDLSGQDRSPQQHVIWPQQPFIYPPGALLLYAPFGWAEYGLGLSEMAVHRAAVIFCVVLAHLSVLLMLGELRRDGGPLTLLIVALYAMMALGFSLNGLYDPAYVAAGALGLSASRRGQESRAVLWLSLATFLHFRALFYLPAALANLAASGARALKGGLSRREWLRFSVSVLLGAAAAWALLLTWKSFDDIGAPNLVMEEEFGWGGAAVVSAATLGAAAYFLRSGERLAGLSVAWAGALALALPFSRAWHSLALYPLFLLLPPEGRKREVLLLWVLVVSGIAFRYFPSLRWLARGLGTLIG